MKLPIKKELIAMTFGMVVGWVFALGTVAVFRLPFRASWILCVIPAQMVVQWFASTAYLKFSR